MQLLGLHLDKQSILLALVEKDKAQFKIKFLETFSIIEGGEAKALGQQLQLLTLKEEQFFIGAPLETSRILIRTLETPFKSARALLHTLPFQLENMLPYPLEEAIAAPVIEKSLKEKASSVVTLFCVQCKMYEQLLTELQNYQIDPQWVGCIPQALYRFGQHYTQETDYILLHMSERATHIIAVLENRLCHAIQLEAGKEDFLEALARDHPSLDEKSRGEFFNQGMLADNSSTHMDAKTKQFLQELDRVFYFLLHKKEGKKLEKIIFTKEEHFLRKLKSHIEKSLDFSLQEVEIPSSSKLKHYAIPIGSALDVLLDDHKTLQFRTGRNTEKTLSKHILKKIGLYGLSIIASFLMIAGAAQVVLNNKEKMLRTELTTVLSNYAQELGSVATNPDFFAMLKRAEKSVGQVKKPYGYYLMPTKVNDFLKYIDETMQALQNPLIKLEKFHYELVRYPVLAEPLAPYKIKVELSMTADEENTLSKFFEAILKNPARIAQDPEPTITKAPGQYEVTFFLTSS